MTYDEIMDKWGDVELKFTRYYKYVFYYTGETPDGYHITAGYGGDSSEIYRHEVVNGEVQKLQIIFPFEISVYKNSVEVASYCNY